MKEDIDPLWCFVVLMVAYVLILGLLVTGNRRPSPTGPQKC